MQFNLQKQIARTNIHNMIRNQKRDFRFVSLHRFISFCRRRERERNKTTYTNHHNTIVMMNINAIYRNDRHSKQNQRGN